MKQKSIHKLAAICLSISFLAISCGGSKTPAKKITLKFWKTFEESQNMQPMIDAYQKRHPNISIEYTKKNSDGYEADLLDALASGQGPDIFSINNTWLPQYENKISAAPDTAFNLRDF